MSEPGGRANQVHHAPFEVAVRAVGEEDVSALAGLLISMRLRESWLRDPELTSDDESPFYALAARRARDPDTVLLVAYGDGQPVGFYCGQVRGQVGRGIDLYVRPPARRRGVGRLLVSAALAEYRARGADRLVGSLPGDEGCHAFWASIWTEHPSRLVSRRSTPGMEWRTRSLARESREGREGEALGPPHKGQGQPAGQSNP